MYDTKICINCQQEKPLDCFDKITLYNGNPGFQNQCRQCLKEKRRLRRERIAISTKPIINQKFCKRCGQIYSIEIFKKDSGSKDGYYVWCKPCTKIYSTARKQRVKKQPKISIEGKECYVCKLYKIAKEFGNCEQNKDGLNKTCKQCMRLYSKKRGENFAKQPKPEIEGKVCSSCRKYKLKHCFCKNRNQKDGLHFACKECISLKQKANRPKISEYTRKRRQEPLQKLIHNIRTRLALAIKSGSKFSNTFNLLGCTGEECMKYLETLFWPGMTRDNYGNNGWVVDHIIPVNSFDKTDPNWQFKAFHYTNLQPLWRKDNNEKDDRLDWTPAESKYELPERLKEPGSAHPPSECQ